MNRPYHLTYQLGNRECKATVLAPGPASAVAHIRARCRRAGLNPTDIRVSHGEAL